MKSILALLLSLSCLTCFAQQQTIRTDSVYISGKIKRYIENKDSANAVVFTVNDIVFGEQLNYRAKIQDNGFYKIAFLKTGTQDVFMEYGENLEVIIVSPGDHLQISFDANDMEHTLTFNGSNVQVNRNLQAYTRALNKERKRIYGDDFGRFNELVASEKNNQSDAHKKFLTDRFIKEKAFLSTYIKQPKLTPLFKKWAITDLRCEYINNLLRYTWLHPSRNQIKPADFKLPDSYFDFTRTVSFDNPELAISSNYYDYIHEYRSIIINNISSNPVKFDDIIALFAKQPQGFAKDAMMSNIISELITAKHLDAVKPYLDTLKKYVSYPVFKTRIFDAYNAALIQQNNYKLPPEAKINTTPNTEADSLLKKILLKYPGKVIYVDFWATWCGPCRAEMRNSGKLHEQYLNKDVVFLYLGVQSKEKIWKAAIAELDIKGEHYLLNEPEFSALAEKFQINGIPRYLLVDKRGVVINDHAKRPSDNAIKPEIDVLLAKK